MFQCANKTFCVKRRFEWSHCIVFCWLNDLRRNDKWSAFEEFMLRKAARNFSFLSIMRCLFITTKVHLESRKKYCAWTGTCSVLSSGFVLKFDQSCSKINKQRPRLCKLLSSNVHNFSALILPNRSGEWNFTRDLWVIAERVKKVNKFLNGFLNREFSNTEADGIRKMFPAYATAEINVIVLNAFIEKFISLSLHCDHVESEASITVFAMWLKPNQIDSWVASGEISNHQCDLREKVFVSLYNLSAILNRLRLLKWLELQIIEQSRMSTFELGGGHRALLFAISNDLNYETNLKSFWMALTDHL